jgi:hypothetical protein
VRSISCKSLDKPFVPGILENILNVRRYSEKYISAGDFHAKSNNAVVVWGGGEGKVSTTRGKKLLEI